MALQKTITTKQGLTAPDAYIRVEGVRLLSKTNMEFQVRKYAQSTGVPFFDEETVSCAFDIGGGNPFEQAYQFLKTKSNYTDAVDV